MKAIVQRVAQASVTGQCVPTAELRGPGAAVYVSVYVGGCACWWVRAGVPLPLSPRVGLAWVRSLAAPPGPGSHGVRVCGVCVELCVQPCLAGVGWQSRCHRLLERLCVGSRVAVILLGLC